MSHDTFMSGFPGGSVVKNPPANVDVSSIPGSGTSPGERNGKPLPYSCLGNPMDRGVWQATVHRVTKESDTVTKKKNHFYATSRHLKVFHTRAHPPLNIPELFNFLTTHPNF